MPQSKKTPDDPEAAAAAKERRALDEVFSLMYEELRRIAAALRRNEGNITLSAGALVREAWLRLKDSPELAATTPLHFRRIAAQVMRRVLVDAARARNAEKRGGPDAIRVTVDDSVTGAGAFDTELLAVHEALDRLAEKDARQAKIAELRIFSELTNAEIAEELAVHISTVERDWKFIRAWLKKELFPNR